MDEWLRPRVMAVVVVYERGLTRVEAWQTLQRLLHVEGNEAHALAHVLIYDNSLLPLAQPKTSIARCSYRHDPGNGGTAAAYAHAADVATELNIDWLLLLDHDTHLPARFLDDACAALQASKALKPAALLPWVCHEGTVVSPARVTRFGSIRPLRRGAAIQPDARLTAIASGSLLRVSALRALLPIPAELWLDYVDHWVFGELHAQGATVVVFEQVLRHDLSIASPASLSTRRLSSVLDGEARFHRTLGQPARLIYPVRLLARMLRMLWLSPPLARHTVGWALKRLSLGKA